MACALYVISRINMRPCKYRQDRVSPFEALRGRKLDAKRDLQLGFGDYCEVKEKETSNSVSIPRTRSCVAVTSTGSLTGDWQFFDPYTNGLSIITRHQWRGPLPMSNSMIERLNDLWFKEWKIAHPDTVVPPRTWPSVTIGHTHREIEDLPGDEADTAVDNTILIPANNDNAVEFETIEEPAVDQVDDIILADKLPLSSPIPAVTTTEFDFRGDTEEFHNQDPIVCGDNSSDAVADAELRGVIDDNGECVSQDNDFEISEEACATEAEPEAVSSSPAPERRYSQRLSPATPRYPVRKRKGDWKDYSERQNAFVVSSALSRVMAGRKYGSLALEANVKEVFQTLEYDVFAPKLPEELTLEEQKRALRSHTLFQPKHDKISGDFKKLKARFVGDGSTQDRSNYEDVASATVATQSIFMLAAINAAERRKVATVDIPGAFLQADMDATGDKVNIRIDKHTAAIMVNLRPEWAKFVRKSDGVLFAELNKALYGLIESSMRWYKDISGYLKSLGYVPNPKDCCVFNRVHEGVQCTVTLHVDDLKISSVDETMIDDLIDNLKSRYGKLQPLTVNRGKIHEYLGMVFDYSIDGEVHISMVEYVKDLLLLTGTSGKVDTPQTANLFKVDAASPALSGDDADSFHSIAYKLLYLTKRARPDILLAAQFLSRRVLRPTEEDKYKLDRALKYLCKTSDLKLILRPGDNFKARIFIDASHAIHDDYKSQKGMVVTMGDSGAVLAKTSTVKLNTKSSCESEIIALSDYGCWGIWTGEFMVGQGYEQEPQQIFQDNQSCIALVKKGYSTSDSTRHINIRYFWLKNRVDTGEIKLEFMPTDSMIADFFTKPLTGAAFIKMRDIIMGHVSAKGSENCLFLTYLI